ncbi:MAG: sigma-70 family RNA polymerase sigma factor [Candidatus Omnitrophica bacterium]|nr:sigma-70 family RNA polymerase sigma factor [Candidatus Omnitrophota bacterium]
MPNPRSDSTRSQEEALRGLVLSDPEEGWRRFWKEYGAFARSLIRKYGFSPQDSEEVFQELGIRLLKNETSALRSWDPERCSLRGFLAVVTSSVCVDFARSKFHKSSKLRSDYASANEIALALAVDPAPSPAERLERILQVERLQRWLSEWSKEGTLRDRDQLILEAHIAGMTNLEIQEVAGVPKEEVANRLHRLKERLISRVRSINSPLEG